MSKHMAWAGLALALITAAGGVAAGQPTVGTVPAGCLAQRPRPAETYIYNTRAEALAAADAFRARGRTVDGPHEILGQWHLFVS